MSGFKAFYLGRQIRKGQTLNTGEVFESIVNTTTITIKDANGNQKHVNASKYGVKVQ